MGTQDSDFTSCEMESCSNSMVETEEVETTTGVVVREHEEIEGLFMVEEIVDEEEEERILACLRGEDGWRTMSKRGRRVLHFGHIFDYVEEVVVEAKDHPIPDYLDDVMESIQGLDVPGAGGKVTAHPLEPERQIQFDQIIVNAYDKTQGIHPHVDRTHCFGPVIVGLSLGDSATLTFSRRSEWGHHTHQVFLPRRSVYIMTGDARYLWRHGLDPALNARSRSGERVSITWREVISPETAARVVPPQLLIPGITFSSVLPESDVTFDGSQTGTLIGRRGKTQRALCTDLSLDIVLGTLLEDPSVGVARILSPSPPPPSSLAALSAAIHAILTTE